MRKNLEAWIAYRRFTEWELAKASGVPYHNIHRVITGATSDMRAGEAVRVARALGVTVEDLVEGCAPKEASV